MENFGSWLLDELQKRKMTQSELSRKAGLGSGTISNIMNGEKKVGQDTALAIAAVLHLPPELVFEKAGILPPKPEISPIRRQLLHASEGLPDSDIELALKILESRAEYYVKNPQAKPKNE